MENTYKIYGVLGPTGKLYIGKTKYPTIEERWKVHLQAVNNLDNTWYFYNAIRKHGSNLFKIFLITEVGSLEELDRTEKLYIHLFQTNNQKFGYNSTSGGNDVEFTEEVLQKMSTKAKKRWEGRNIERSMIIVKKKDTPGGEGTTQTNQKRNPVNRTKSGLKTTLLLV